MTKLHTPIHQFLGVPLANAIEKTFACMKIAEEEIERAKNAATSAAITRSIHSAFKFLCPTDPILDLHPEIYRAHVRELIARVAKTENSPAHYGLDYTITLFADVPAKFVTSHYHPQQIPDPHSGLLPYFPPQLQCDLCG